uniref:TSA: Wollemia nobilis Ref_Wollemi_Transcript_997_1867 transcribed RNA sequence n=1 Tax=Wollemia nobilis TaxID=56998 RepID=A0A0C9S9E6_9CONI
MEFWKIVVKFLVLCSVWEWAWAKTLESDVQALILFKNAVEADTIDPSRCLGSWNFSVDPCDFRSTTQFVCGIRCDVKTGGKSRVTSLALDGVGYRGYVHGAIGNLTELTELNLGGNGFHGTIPESITGLGKLSRLDLSGNMLSGGLPLSLGRLKSLQVLSLSRNMLSGSLPGSLNDLKSLMRLDLSYNNLGGRIPPLGGLIQLYNLDMSFNRLVGVIPSELPGSLSQLTLKSNLLSGGVPSSLGRVMGLGVLDLSCNRLSGAIDGSLFSYPELQQVNLANNSFSAISVPDLSGVESQLVAVDIGSNKIGGLLPSNFSTLQSLAALSLRYNGFQGPIPAGYGAKAANAEKPLARLFLDGNYLNGGVPREFLRISSEKITGSFANNCLESCPSNVLLCKGAQRPASVCRRAYRNRKGPSKRSHVP